MRILEYVYDDKTFINLILSQEEEDLLKSSINSLEEFYKTDLESIPLNKAYFKDYRLIDKEDYNDELLKNYTAEELGEKEIYFFFYNEIENLEEVREKCLNILTQIYNQILRLKYL